MLDTSTQPNIQIPTILSDAPIVSVPLETIDVKRADQRNDCQLHILEIPTRSYEIYMLPNINPFLVFEIDCEISRVYHSRSVFVHRCLQLALRFRRKPPEDDIVS
jgi:hypothetical protein